MMQHSSADTLVDTIVSDFERQIDAKSLMPGDKLPSENEISRTYMASRFIVRRAFRRLELAGRVDAIQGKGRFVKCKPLVFNVKRHVELPTPFEESLGEYQPVITKQRQQKASPALASAMSISAGDRVYFVERLLNFNKIPFALMRQHIPMSRFPDFHTALEASGGSVSHALAGYGMAYYEAGDTMIRACNPPPEEREMLRSPLHVPFIELKQLCTDPDGVVLLMTTLAPSDRIEVIIPSA